VAALEVLVDLDPYGLSSAAACAGWFGSEMAFAMSWQSAATTTSLSAPARSARAAVWQTWVSWSTAKPFVIPANARS
jgi:hypothetical protein